MTPYSLKLWPGEPIFPPTLTNQIVIIRAGIPLNVSSPRESLQLQAGWQELVKDNSPAGYSFDQEQSVLWIRLTKDGLMNIVLKWNTYHTFTFKLRIEFIQWYFSISQ